MATLKELKEHYRVVNFPNVKGYSIYDKEEHSGRRCVYKYLCSVEKRGSKIGIIGTAESFNNIESLKKAIIIYVEALDYDSEYYDPSWRKGLFEEMVINDYLSERGFKSELGWGKESMFYVLKEKNIYYGNTEPIALEIDGICADDDLPEDVKVKFKTSAHSWIEDSCKRNVVDIIKTIDSLLKPFFITEGVRNIKHADDYNLEEFKATINKFDTQSFQTLTADYKAELKDKLQTMIDVL